MPGSISSIWGWSPAPKKGLRTLHKEITVEENLAAVRVLKSLGIRFEFGFMLLDPSSTFASVRANVGFLRDIVGDGSASAQFCKMLPYDGTPIKDDAGRIRPAQGRRLHARLRFPRSGARPILCGIWRRSSALPAGFTAIRR